MVGLFRADSGFYDKGIVAFLKARQINDLISAKLEPPYAESHVRWCERAEGGNPSPYSIPLLRRGERGKSAVPTILLKHANAIIIIS